MMIMKVGNLVRIKQVPGRDAAGNPIQEHLGVYLGEETYHKTTVYEVLILGEPNHIKYPATFGSWRSYD